MKKPLLITFTLSLALFTAYFLFSASMPANTDTLSEEAYTGTWEYRQKNSSATSGYDNEGERFVIGTSNGKFTLTYYSLEREGEHGLFYSVSKPKQLRIKNNIIEFTIGERDIYSKRPSSLDEISKYKEFNAGFINSHLEFKGVVKANSITFTCTPASECPENIMIFRRNYWK